jgi:hypothetical protein
MVPPVIMQAAKLPEGHGDRLPVSICHIMPLEQTFDAWLGARTSARSATSKVGYKPVKPLRLLNDSLGKMELVFHQFHRVHSCDNHSVISAYGFVLLPPQ